MIRPITIVTFLMACGSGMYLYQSKHEVQMLDRKIEKTVHDTNALREQSRLLATEWTMLNDPERLQQFSDTYLNLKSINPAQFTSLNDLDNRLPAPVPEAPPPAEDTTPIAQTGPSPPQLAPDPAPSDAPPAAAAAVAEDDNMPVPPVPVPAARPVQMATPAARPVSPKVATVRPADVKPAEPRVAEQRATEQRATEQRATEQHAVARVAEARADTRTPSALVPRPIMLPQPRPQPVYTQTQPQAVAERFRPAQVAAQAAAPAPAPFTGSLLGMARGSMPPAPRPTPVNASYNAN